MKVYAAAIAEYSRSRSLLPHPTTSKVTVSTVEAPAAPDLVRRGEVIAFVGWIAPYAYGVIAPGGYEATRFAMRTWGCGC